MFRPAVHSKGKIYLAAICCAGPGEDVQIVANYFWQGPVVSELVRLMASRSSRALTVSFNMNNG